MNILKVRCPKCLLEEECLISLRVVECLISLKEVECPIFQISLRELLRECPTFKFQMEDRLLMEFKGHHAPLLKSV
jgi:hypothetical protein